MSIYYCIVFLCFSTFGLTVNDTIFRDLLNFPPDPGGGGFTQISSADLYRKIEELENNQIDVHASEPYSQQNKNGPLVMHGGLSSEDIKLRLAEIKKIAQWAMKNNYDNIYVM